MGELVFGRVDQNWASWFLGELGIGRVDQDPKIQLHESEKHKQFVNFSIGPAVVENA